MSEGAVQHPQTVGGVLDYRQPQAVEVVAQEAEALHVLFHGSGNGFDLAERLGVPEAHCPAESGSKGGLSVLPGKHPHGLLIPADVRIRQKETA